MLRRWCAARGTGIDPPAIERLSVYRELLLDWNTRLNLTALSKPKDVLIKHFLDSLAILPWVPPGDSILDIGSGAGIPGLVLKLARPQQPITLAEATGKKIGFLEHVRRTFRLEDCQVLHRRLTGGEADLNGRFGVVVSRGVQSPGPFVLWAGRYPRPGGRVIAMTGRVTPPPDLTTAAFEGSALCRLEHVERFELPERAGVRHLLIFRRMSDSVPRGT